MKVFFDVDGVLIDGWHSDPARRKRWDEHMERDLGVPREAFQEVFFAPSGDGANSPMRQCVRGERDLKEALGSVLPGLGYEGSVDAFVTYWFENDSNVNNGVLDIARRLKAGGSAGLFLVTGQEHYRAEWLWHELGFREHFHDILYSARLGRLKSEPEFYRRINSVLGIIPGENPLYFDDHEACVRLARAAGWDAHIFTALPDMTGHERLKGLLAGRGD